MRLVEANSEQNYRLALGNGGIRFDRLLKIITRTRRLIVLTLRMTRRQKMKKKTAQ